MRLSAQIINNKDQHENSTEWNLDSSREEIVPTDFEHGQTS